jgi:hypothetical protein
MPSKPVAFLYSICLSIYRQKLMWEVWMLKCLYLY